MPEEENKPGTGTEGGSGGEEKPGGAKGGNEDPNRLPDDHPVAVALAKANKEAETARLELKSAKDALKKHEDAGKTELEKAQSAAQTAQYEADEAKQRALRMEVAMDKGLTLAQGKRLVGTTKEELEKDAEELLKEFGASANGSGDGKKPPQRKPAERLKTGTGSDESGPENVSDIVAKVRRY